MKSIIALILTVATITVSSSLTQAENCIGRTTPPKVIPPASKSNLKADIQAYNIGQYKYAERFFSTFVSREPTNDQARYYLALSLQELNQLQAARAQYGWLARNATKPDIRACARKGEQMLAQAEIQVQHNNMEAARQHRITYFNPPDRRHWPRALKPVIYLYPQVTEKVKVELKYKGKLCTTYPAYNPAISGWAVMAQPDGTLVNDADGKEYSYLFWDGKDYNFPIDMREGFVVKGADTAHFLQTTLKKLGLTAKEYNEFIVYWLPKMQDNRYNFIHFAGKEYTDAARLTIMPQPNSILRVFMMYKPLQKPIAVKKQTLSSFNRHGFAVIEWGGCELLTM